MPTDYTLMDATLEILLMLLAAFLLGWLFCWIIKKLFGGRNLETAENAELKGMTTGVSADISQQASQPQERSGLSASSRERLYDPEHGLTKDTLDASIPTIETSDLSVDELDFDAAANRPRIDLPDLNMPEPDLKGKLSAGMDLGKGGLKKGLGAAAVGLGGIAAGASAMKDKAVDSIPDVELPDIDLKGKLDTGLDAAKAGLDNVTGGIGSLKDKAMDSVSDMELPDLDLKGKLDAGVDLGKGGIDAGLDTVKSGLGGITAGAGSLKDKAMDSLPDMDLPDLDVKDKLDAGIEAGKSGLGKGFGAATAGLSAIAAGAGSLKDKAVDGVTSGVDTLSTSASSLKDKVTDKGDVVESTTLTPPDLPRSTELEAAIKTPKASLSSSTDDLTRISGIDADTATLLSTHGINSFQALESTDSDTLKSYLSDSDKASISAAEPASWPHQAKLCASQNWGKLAEYQSFLSGTAATATPAVEEVTNKDDLKKIEGIGPFFESLLNKAGITTYAQLKESDRDTLKEIIDAAGPDYRLHEPETWPYQAGLADRGEWKKLQDYIHFMTGRS
ncbi:helix-hairpin-helix domain-containing protein [Leucothrix arctica]|uniref:Uncharacterized protein n=1 Tax=Leucothrix arctica TaxID=1481894 RepID=A0A317CNF1_9GAMM|nr:helix-hairpin-helix domain-containing protein [Leucothrix arctica]PWQ99003.1 hypothetical protein DKT75_02270 [Leucothrix arctica]